MNQRVFDEWRDKPLDEALYECREMFEDTTFPTVRRWRDAGGKVVGHFQVYFPEEIVHAAGLLPVKIRGAQVEAMHADSRFGSYLCSILKTSLELGVERAIAVGDVRNSSDLRCGSQPGGGVGEELHYPCQILYLPQNANSSHAATYLRGEYDRLKRAVESISAVPVNADPRQQSEFRLLLAAGFVSGAPVTDDALRNSIAIYNQNRALLRELYAIKRDSAVADLS